MPPPVTERDSMTENELKRRTKRFGLDVMALVGKIPRTRVAEAIARQFVKSGTSVGANYRSACRGRSRAEFAAKVGIAEEEADESAYWLELIVEGRLLPEAEVSPVLREANELTAIMAASGKTARSKR
jgi:four helix bundle protein